MIIMVHNEGQTAILKVSKDWAAVKLEVTVEGIGGIAVKMTSQEARVFRTALDEGIKLVEKG